MMLTDTRDSSAEVRTVPDAGSCLHPRDFLAAPRSTVRPWPASPPVNTPALEERGVLTCRACGQTTLRSVFDLGEQPLSNELGVSADDVLDRFPLHLRICLSCGLGQLGEFVLPDRIFGDDYPYLSSTSSSWVEHARRYAAEVTDALRLRENDLVLEIASNDGYLLSAFQQQGTKVLGIEPARNVAPIAVRAGIPTINEFFGLALADRLVAEHGHPRLVVANNVLAHVPDLEDFVRGLAALCGEDTVSRWRTRRSSTSWSSDSSTRSTTSTSRI